MRGVAAQTPESDAWDEVQKPHLERKRGVGVFY